MTHDDRLTAAHALLLDLDAPVSTRPLLDQAGDAAAIVEALGMYDLGMFLRRVAGNREATA